jgi:hypothetical protein
MAVVDNPELLRFLREEASNARDDILDQQRAVAIDFYNGEPFGDEEEGRSQLVTRDVAEVIDYMVPSIMRTMVSGDKVVEFESNDQGGKQAADDATALIQYDLMRRQRGYRMLHDFLKAGLLEKSGVAKSWVEQRSERVEVEVPEDAVVLTPEGGAHLIDGTPVLDIVAGADERLIAAPDGIDVTPATVRAVIERPLPPLFRDMAVPNEEFGVSRDARSLDEAAYLYHKTRVSLATLIAMGYDPDDVQSLYDDGQPGTVVQQARDRDRTNAGDVQRIDTSRLVWLWEEYPLWSNSPDSEPQRMVVHRVGNTILSAEVYESGKPEDQPFEVWTPFPMPHRIVGQSLADKVMDVQRVRSVLLRQAADNLYQSNSPRVLVPENDQSPNLIDDLLTVRPGALIRYSGTVPPSAFAVPFTADKAFTAMEMMAGEKESRTGITRLNQGLDADTLNKTATGTALMQASGQQIEEYLARNFAEAVARVADRKRRLMKRYAALTRILVDGKYREINPQSWPDDMEVNVRVGLGTGRKDVRLQYRQMILALQQAAVQAKAPVGSWKGVYNNLSGIIADTALGNVTDFFTDPGDQPIQQDAQSPEMAAAQAKATIEAQKLQGDQQKQQAEIQMKARGQEIEREVKLAGVQASAEVQQWEAQQRVDRDQARAEAEAALAVQRLDFDMGLARERQAFDMELARERASGADSGGGLPAYRPGGELDK